MRQLMHIGSKPKLSRVAVGMLALLIAVQVFSPFHIGTGGVTQNDPTACGPIGPDWTNCADAFSSNNVYALANDLPVGPVTFPAQTVGTAYAINPTFAHNSPAGTDTIVIYTFAGDDGNEPTSVTYAGQALTLLDESINAGNVRSQIWYRVNATSGTNNFVVSGSGGLSDSHHTGKTFHGVDQTNPFGSPADTNTATGGSGDPSVTITTSADQITTEVSAFVEETGSVDPTNVNSVEDSDSGIQPRGVDSHTDTTGAITVGWTQIADSTPWAIAVADIAAPPGTPALPGKNDTAWRNFGFVLDPLSTIITVEIGVEWFRTTSEPILNVTISWDGGLTWATNQTATNKSADDNTVEFLDFSSATAWTPAKLNDANLRARVGTNASDARLDYVTVRVNSNIPPVISNFRIQETGSVPSQRDPTACEAVGDNWTNCQDAFASEGAYAFANDTVAASGLSVKVDSFTRQTGTGNQAVTGVGFTPKVVVFWGTLKTAEGFSADLSHFQGFMVSATDQRALANFGTGGGAAGRMAQKAIVIISSNTPTISAEADFVSFDADGYTIDWTTNDGTQNIIHYMALGGADLASVKVGHFVANDVAPGNQGVTGVGFQPKMVFMMGHGRIEAIPDDQTRGNFFGGYAVSSTERATLSWAHRDTTGRQATNQRTDRVIVVADQTGTNQEEADFVSMDADGFTINWLAVNRALIIPYLAIGGVDLNVKVGSFDSATATGNQAVTGTGFQPDLVRLMTWSEPTSAAILTDTKAAYGAATDPTAQGVAGVLREDATPANADDYTLTTKVIRLADPGAPPTTLAEADFVSFGADGFTLDWTTADGTGREILYWAVGGTATGGASGITFQRAGGTGQSNTHAIDIGTAGNDRLVVVYGSIETNGQGQLTDVTVDGKSANFIALAQNDAPTGSHTQMWAIDEAALGASNGVVTCVLVGGTGSWGIHVQVFYGVESSTPFDSAIDNTSVSPDNEIKPAVVNIPANGLLVFLAGHGSTGTFSDTDWDTSPTEVADDGLSPEIEMTEVTDGFGAGSPGGPFSAVMGTAYWISTEVQQNNRQLRAQASINPFSRGSGVIASFSAASGTPGKNDTAWRNFGFALDPSATINTVEIGVEWFRSNTAPILNVTVSWDGGASWATNQTATNKSADDNVVEFLDFTSATAWTPAKLNDANLRVRVGTNASGAHLDYVTVRVTSSSGELTFSQQTTGANYRIVLTYLDTADPTTASLSEWSVTEGRATYNASASGLTAILSGPTIIGYEFRLALKFGFQVKHAVAPTNSTVGSYNDFDSWNGEVVATDGPHTITLQEASTGEHMEFGVFMYTFVNISADWAVTVNHGSTANTNTVTVFRRSNDDFTLKIWFVTDLIKGGDTIPITNVQILAAGDLTDDITADTAFAGLGEGNATYILGSATLWFSHSTGTDEDTTTVQFSVTVAFGTPLGLYTAQLTIRIQQQP